MKLPLQITARNVSLSEAAENAIREKAAKLETFHDNTTACRVLVEVPHRHKNHGMTYNVNIDITVPGNEIVVKREPNEDLYVAIRDSFDAARRQLKEIAARRRGDVKTHVNGSNGRFEAEADITPEELDQTPGNKAGN
jgi:ribosomal subunit interface protein